MAGESVLAKMAVLISANTAQFSQALAASNKQLSSFGDAVKTANNLLATFGIGFGAIQVFSGIKAGIGIMSDFEHTMSEVKAITGATGKEFEALEKDALRLGASTKFTATQVGQLQVAYGRLGFTTKEILAATEATLDLAAATGEDLAKSADVAGSTVRGFGLDASETQRVVDVMASSFNKTALGLENFTESMKYVAPIANAANVSVEETTALLGVLADSGIRGSQAGTALRKIFGDLSRDGRPVQERLKELGDRGISLADSFDEVGRTAQTALLVLTKNTSKADDLTKAFQNASGEASKMARIMGDDFEGDVTKLTSAWEGLILAFTNSDVIRNVTQNLTGFLNALSGTKDLSGSLDLIAKRFTDSNLKNGTSTFDFFKNQIIELRKELGKPIDTNIIEELAAKYNLTSKQVADFRDLVDEANKELSFQEDAIRLFNEFAKKNGYTDLAKGAEDYVQSLNDIIIALTNQQQGLKQIQIEDGNNNFDKDINKIQNQIDAYLRVIAIIKDLKTTQDGLKPPPALVETKGLIESLEERIKITEQALKKAFTVPQIRQLQNEIKDLKEELESLLVADTKTPSFDKALSDRIDSTISSGVKSTFKIPKVDSKDFEKSLEMVHNVIVARGNELKEAFLEINLSGLVSNAIADLSFGLGQAAAGIGNFGDVILRALVGFAKQFGEILIGLGVAALAAKKLAVAPQTAIIAGIALVALSGIASAALNKGQSNYNTGSSSGVGTTSSVNNRITGNGGEMRIDLTVSGKANGRELQYVLDSYNVSRGRTG